MSSTLHPESISRNLVRISGPGYRENIELGEADERARDADLDVSHFEAGVTPAVIAFSRFSHRPETQFHTAVSRGMQSVDIASYLSGRRDTLLPLSKNHVDPTS
ncbi:hypothetical protein EDE05_11114 [Neorhizobium sp. R1-B]|uniref:hypothetical protein n=1 Tax=unclassified Neorhizobium TaxID=2629175 RepID=UPI00104B5AE5|nr:MULTISPECIES: hypothetical protein [unclassified Neorhizobium]TCV69999.1 hypothetical protein EDE09_10914 [Neorhizobium sp. S3-V5DH]TDX80341.1 hypothetical protein EDE05_11114 [Neorhizobium sp. R1-B]